jgi:hypothetical protein
VEDRRESGLAGDLLDLEDVDAVMPARDVEGAD